MKKELSISTTVEPNFIARYFLRRLAIAHRQAPTRKRSVQYTTALLETILIVVAMPVLTVVSLIVIPSLRWAPDAIAKWFGFSPRGAVLIVGMLSLLAGHRWIGNRMKQYREDQSAYIDFAGKRDSRIVLLQKVGAVFVGGILLPGLTMFVTFGTQVFVRAFDLQ